MDWGVRHLGKDTLYVCMRADVWVWVDRCVVRVGGYVCDARAYVEVRTHVRTPVAVDM